MLRGKGPTWVHAGVMDMFIVPGHYPFLLLLLIAPLFRWGSPSLCFMRPAPYAHPRFQESTWLKPGHSEPRVPSVTGIGSRICQWVASAGSRGTLRCTFTGIFGQEAVSSSARLPNWWIGSPALLKAIFFCKYLEALAFASERANPGESTSKRQRQEEMPEDVIEYLPCWDRPHPCLRRFCEPTYY